MHCLLANDVLANDARVISHACTSSLQAIFMSADTVYCSATFQPMQRQLHFDKTSVHFLALTLHSAIDDYGLCMRIRARQLRQVTRGFARTRRYFAGTTVWSLANAAVYITRTFCRLWVNCRNVKPLPIRRSANEVTLTSRAQRQNDRP